MKKVDSLSIDYKSFKEFRHLIEAARPPRFFQGGNAAKTENYKIIIVPYDCRNSGGVSDIYNAFH